MQKKSKGECIAAPVSLVRCRAGLALVRSQKLESPNQAGLCETEIDMAIHNACEVRALLTHCAGLRRFTQGGCKYQ